MADPLMITDLETKGADTNKVAVYWCGTKVEPKQFGVCFDGPFFNIARQGIAESILLSLSIANDLVEAV